MAVRLKETSVAAVKFTIRLNLRGMLEPKSIRKRESVGFVVKKKLKPQAGARQNADELFHYNLQQFEGIDSCASL